MRSTLYIFLFLFLPLLSNAQAEKRWLKHELAAIASTTMHGRGYVHKGAEKAARYISRRFREFGLVSLNKDSNYAQSFSFAVNTFPGELSLQIRKKELQPGADFLVDAASASFYADKAKLRKVNLDKIKDSAEWSRARAQWYKTDMHLLLHTDSFCKRLGIRPRDLAKTLPAGAYIIPQHNKLMWTVATETMPATVIYVADTSLPKRAGKTTLHVKSEYLPERKNKNENIVATVPGEVKDSFIVFSAHYDHLGMMGPALFPGASDNASGTAMLLYLARYYSEHPQRYSMVFIAFAGEEAGLLGSDYFVKHPIIPLERIKFLTNLDIMGDATDGITVVNATEYPQQFDLLQRLNTKGKYLPQIKSRGKAANSDHYHFSEAGVPAFFIYTNGGKGYYHDIYDKPQELSLNNIGELATLLRDFTTALNGAK